MRVEVRGSAVDGGATAPPSKSYTHRALVCAALARGASRILNPLRSDDTDATRRILTALGVEVTEGPRLWTVRGGELSRPPADLFCAESATTLRFMAAVCALVDGECRLTCGPSLRRRPVEPLLDGLRQLGVACSSAEGYPPVTISGRGGIGAGQVSMRGDISSQFVSAILLIAPFAEEGVSLRLTAPLESRPYVSMTMEIQGRFGVEVEAADMREFRVENQSYEPAEVAIEGDWSSAAYLLAAGALAGRVAVAGLNAESLQADASIIGLLRSMGASVDVQGGEVTALRSELTGVEFDLSDCPDLFPVAAVLCASARGESTLTGVERLRYKESDRAAAVVENLRRMGVEARQGREEVRIVGGNLRGGVVDPRRDHRIAMAFAVLGLAAGGPVTILDAECVSKSYPEFWEAMAGLGADLGRVDDGQ